MRILACAFDEVSNRYVRINIGGDFFMEDRLYEENRKGGVHKVYLNARKTAVLSGVRDVLSFDAKEVYLETEQGILLIRGDELHVNRLSLEKGEVDVDGRIDSFAYSDREETQKKASSFFGRMFQ